MKRFLVALCGLMAWATAAQAQFIYIPVYTPPPQVREAKTADYDGIRTVAILSAIGTRLTARNNHFLGPKNTTFGIEEWELDKIVAAMLRQYLGEKFTFRDVSYDPKTIADIPNGAFVNSTSALRLVLQTIPREGVDAFIVVRPSLAYRAPGVEGIALENGNGINDPNPVVWANYEIEIVNTRTYETIAQAFSRVRLREGETQDFFPGLEADRRLVLDDSFALSLPQRTLLRTYVNRLLTASMIETIRALQFGVALPGIGERRFQPIPDANMPFQQIKTVAVVSGLGETLDIEHTGTIFNMSSLALPVPEWRLDENIEEAAKIAMQPRFQFKDVPFDRTAFAAARLLNEKNEPVPAFPGLQKTEEVDAYIAFIKVREPVLGIPRGGLGVGLWHNFAMPDATGVFANYGVVVINARTLEVIAARAGISSPKFRNSRPLLPLDDKLWPGAEGKFGPGQEDAIKAEAIRLLRDSAEETLLSMGLRGIMVDNAPPGAIAAQ